MTTDLNKLTKLEALKQLAQRINDDFATKSSVSTLEGKVDALELAGGEKNIIEKIKVNGENQSISEDDKSVNIVVPQNVSELKDHDNYATVASVDAKISSVYKPGGSKKFTELPSASKQNLGYVYNVTDEFTTDDQFIDGLENKYPAGTNVVVVDNGSEDYKYDVLAGFVDLTEYAKIENVVVKDGNKVLSSNDYTNEDKQKLTSLNNYVHPDSDAGVNESDLYKIATDKYGHVVNVVKILKQDIVDLGIPASDTTYNEASVDEHGLMSISDKNKLDGIEIASNEDVSAVLDEVFSGE